MKLFLLTLIPPALWAVANHVDKFLVSRYFKDASLGAMMVFSSLIGVLVLPVALFLQDQAFAVGFLTPMIIVLNGCLYLIGVQLYLMGLRVSDASTAVPILQMTPVLLPLKRFNQLNSGGLGHLWLLRPPQGALCYEKPLERQA